MNKQDLINLQKKMTQLRAEGKYKETLETGYLLLQCGMEQNDYKSILIAHFTNAAAYYCIGDIEEAFNSIGEADEICVRFGDDADFLNLYNILFLLYEYKKDFNRAKETLTKSIELGIKLKHYNIASNGYSNFSHILLTENDYSHALEMGEKGLEMAKLHQPASPILELRVRLNIAQSYIGLKDFDASGKIINEMKNDPILDSFIREKSQFYILQGSWLSNQKFYKEAYESLSIAKELVESYKDIYLLKVIQEERSKLCELMNDIPLGYAVQKEYIAVLNEISNRELSLTALKLEVKHGLTTIKKQAYTDYLTGLYNRNYLENTTNEWLKESTLNNESIVCIVFDIDHFKWINDEFGHLFGDEVIKQVSNAASCIIEEKDLFGRYGGDEFVVLLRNSTLKEGKKKAEQIIEVLRNLEIEKNGKVLSIRTSIGISDNSNAGIKNFSDLFHSADKALYKAKQNGKNQICIEN